MEKWRTLMQGLVVASSMGYFAGPCGEARRKCNDGMVGDRNWKLETWWEGEVNIQHPSGEDWGTGFTGIMIDRARLLGIVLRATAQCVIRKQYSYEA
jgi:hypothetical protein